MNEKQLFRESVENAESWSPSRPEVDTFQTGELESMYGQSFDFMQLGKAAFTATMDQMSQVVNSFKGQLGTLAAEASLMERDIMEGPSIVAAEAGQALAANVTAQLEQGADDRPGSRASTQARMISGMGGANAALAIQSASAGSQEDLARKAELYQSRTQSNQNLMNALKGAAASAAGASGIAGAAGESALRQQAGGLDQLIGARGRLDVQAGQYSGLRAKAAGARLRDATRAGTTAHTERLIRARGKSEADRMARAAKRKRFAGQIASYGAAGGAFIDIMKGRKGKGKKK